ncbi:VOC family protein [Paucisalibacillus sp. EB02]|uniref:VOC family protein n=1 Tax=Paucisalibacillus sp. EB02 TaxID=1347087 RepID=UPI0004B68D7B|nr:VOC family protein [Paucisalibacillus sp. EB02]
MIFEMTIQIRVTDFEKGLQWYQLLLDKEPDFIPHAGFAEWELIPGSWLQLAEGIPTEGSGPIRLGVQNIEEIRGRLMNELGLEGFEIFSRAEVPVKWCTFSDPWGNRIGLFEYLDKEEEANRISALLQK